jgi:hypothetical protein
MLASFQADSRNQRESCLHCSGSKNSLPYKSRLLQSSATCNPRLSSALPSRCITMHAYTCDTSSCMHGVTFCSTTGGRRVHNHHQIDDRHNGPISQTPPARPPSPIPKFFIFREHLCEDESPDRKQKALKKRRLLLREDEPLGGVQARITFVRKNTSTMAHRQDLCQ